MSVVSIVIFIILAVALSFSLYYNVKFGLMILKIQDNIEESLDMLDERYASISKILEVPLFYDSQEVRSVLKDVEIARDNMLKIAGLLASIDEEAVEEKEE